jgi:hypothetical protein
MVSHGGKGLPPMARVLGYFLMQVGGVLFHPGEFFLK